MSADLSTLIASAEQVNRAAADGLFAALYNELHHITRHELAKRWSGVTLGATTLLHEAYLDISDRERAGFPDRNRLMAYASCEGSSSITQDDGAPNSAGRVRDHIDDHGPGRQDAQCAAGAGRRFEVLVRLLVRRDRVDDGIGGAARI